MNPSKRPIPIKCRGRPLELPDPDWAKAFYADPPSHDFCVWLITAEAMRRYHETPGPLKVRFGLIEDQLGVLDFGMNSILSGHGDHCKLSRAYYETMLTGVLRPAMEMIGAVEEPPLHAPFAPAALEEYCDYDYHIHQLVDASREGHPIPRWQPPQWARDEVRAYLGDSRPVVITLREATVQPERNSQLEEWIAFALSIKNQHPVLFLRDTARADKPIPAFDIWPRASTNVYVRAALYNQALCNLMVGNGPNIWCIFSSAPYIFFKQLVPALANWDHGKAFGWQYQDHMEVGDHYPWATPLQWLAWLDDTRENIGVAFEQFLRRQTFSTKGVLC